MSRVSDADDAWSPAPPDPGWTFVPDNARKLPGRTSPIPPGALVRPLDAARTSAPADLVRPRDAAPPAGHSAGHHPSHAAHGSRNAAHHSPHPAHATPPAHRVRPRDVTHASPHPARDLVPARASSRFPTAAARTAPPDAHERGLVPAAEHQPADVDRRPKLAVALHDVEPATFTRCVEIREWLYDLGVGRVTLLVIPAPRLHPFPARSPEVTYWLLDRQDAGDAIAQHGLQHRQARPGPFSSRPIRRWQGGMAAEYAGMSGPDAAESVETGRRILSEAGLHPRGFVAPAYAYTSGLRAVLAERFDWWATLLALHGRPATFAPALCLGTSGALKRKLSPLVVRTGASLAQSLLRLDLHPADFDHPRHVAAIERVLERARDRVAVTYDDLC